MKKLIVAALIATACLAYVERTPTVVEEQVAPTRWGCRGNAKRCVWDKAEQVAGYRWACYKKCYWTLEQEIDQPEMKAG